jgi:proline iminopeptidase
VETLDRQVPRTGAVEIDGARLSYEIVGDGEPILVLHGGPGLGYTYLRDDLAGVLGYDFRLIFYDQRGAGMSTGADDPSKLNMATYVADVEGVCDALGLGAVNVMGHSFGGLLAMCHAATHPERLRTLTLVDPDPASYAHWITFKDVAEGRLTDDDRREIARIEAIAGWEGDPDAYERRLRIYLRTYFVDRSRAARLHFGFDIASLRSYLTTRRCVREDLGPYDIHDRLPAVSCPTLILHGRGSVLPLAGARAIHERIPNSRLEIANDAGHFPYTESPAAFGTAVRDFLDAPAALLERPRSGEAPRRTRPAARRSGG